MTQPIQTRRATLADPETWALPAGDGRRWIGHVGFMAARERTPGRPVGPEPRRLVPALAHLW